MSYTISNPPSSVFQRLTDYLASISFFKWFISKGYLQGAFWAIMICVVSSTNDVLMRHLGERLHVTEISFFRFFFSLVSVLPVIMARGGVTLLKTDVLGAHLWRGIIGAIALGLCCLSVNIMPLTENTSIMFAQPLFFLPLAFFLLKEHVDKYRWSATIIGFIGLLVILRPGTDTFRIEAFVPMLAALLFAILDVMAKKMIKNQHPLTLLFYFGLVTTVVSFPIMCYFWQVPTLSELFFLALLGIGANMIQVCLFMAFSATDASGLAPFRYAEFPVAALFGYLFFGQIPTLDLLLGALLIAGSTFFITIIETRKEHTKKA